MERQPGNRGTSLLLDPEAGATGFESFWASNVALMDSGEVIAASVREAAQRAGGTVTRERYAVPAFEREAPLRGGQGVRVTPMDVEPSMLSKRRGRRRLIRGAGASAAVTQGGRDLAEQPGDD